MPKTFDTIDALPKPEYMAEVECKIVKAILKAARDGGYSISINDGEETTVKRSQDWAAILAAMATTEEDWLRLHREGDRTGWVTLVYGNGIDLISDYTTNLEEVMAPLNAYVETLEAA